MNDGLCKHNRASSDFSTKSLIGDQYVSMNTKTILEKSMKKKDGGNSETSEKVLRDKIDRL